MSHKRRSSRRPDGSRQLWSFRSRLENGSPGPLLRGTRHTDSSGRTATGL